MLMTGITILSQTEIINTIGGVGFMWFWVILGVFAAIIITGAICAEDGEVAILLLPALLMSILLGAIIEDATETEKPSGRYTYKVTIDSTVKLSDFDAKYEITGREGKIYIIEERDLEAEDVDANVKD